MLALDDLYVPLAGDRWTGNRQDPRTRQEIKDDLRAQNADLVDIPVSVTNAGPAAATGVAVYAPNPSSLGFNSAITSQGSYNPYSGVWTIGTLASGATATLDLRFLVVAPGFPFAAQVSASDTWDHDTTANNNNPAEVDQDTHQVG